VAVAVAVSLEEKHLERKAAQNNLKDFDVTSQLQYTTAH